MSDECPNDMVFNEDIQKCVYKPEVFEGAWAEFIWENWEEELKQYGNDLPWNEHVELPGDLPVIGISNDEYSRIVNIEFEDLVIVKENYRKYGEKVKFDPSNPQRKFEKEYDPSLSRLKEEIPRYIIDKCEVKRNIRGDGRVLKAANLTDGNRYLLLAFPENGAGIERGFIQLSRGHQFLPFKGEDSFLEL